MQIHHIGAQASLLNRFIAEARDIKIQSDRMRFRTNIQRIAHILGYELSKALSYRNTTVTTPLGEKEIPLIQNKVVICSILRAGIAFHNGLLDYFDGAENAFVSAYRHHTGHGDDFDILVEYLSSPSLQGKTLLLADPMLATGRSFMAAYDALKKMGTPSEIHLLAVVGSTPGIAAVEAYFPEDSHLWIAAMDDRLNEKGYIIPGLGDAGDLAYGPKLQH